MNEDHEERAPLGGPSGPWAAMQQKVNWMPMNRKPLGKAKGKAGATKSKASAMPKAGRMKKGH